MEPWRSRLHGSVAGSPVITFRRDNRHGIELPEASRLGLPGFNVQALEQGQRPPQEIREVAHVPTPPEVAARLEIDEGTGVVVRRLTFWLDDIPVALHDGYFPTPMAAGTAIERPHRIRGGAHALIEDPAGPIRQHVARSVDEISGRMPTPDEVRQLSLPPGVPAFRILRAVYDSEGQPVEVQDSVAAGVSAAAQPPKARAAHAGPHRDVSPGQHSSYGPQTEYALLATLPGRSQPAAASSRTYH